MKWLDSITDSTNMNLRPGGGKDKSNLSERTESTKTPGRNRKEIIGCRVK